MAADESRQVALPAVVVADNHGRVTACSDSAGDILGLPAASLVGRRLSASDGGSIGRIGAAIDRVACGADVADIWPLATGDGSTRWIEVQAMSVGPSGETPSSIVVVLADRDDRSESPGGDDLERTWLAMAVEQSAESIIITDAAARIVYVNPAFEQLTGYRRDEVIGRNPRILKSGAQPATFYDAMWASLLSGVPWVADMVNRRKDGSLYQEEAVFTPILDAVGEIAGYVAVKRDVTRERELEAAGASAARERALIADTLSRLPIGDSTEAAGQAICQQVVSTSGLTHAHLFLFNDASRAIPIGLATMDGRTAESRPLPASRSRRLHRRASEGPWIEEWSKQRGHPYNELLDGLGVRASAYLPVRHAGALIGLLIVGATDGQAMAKLSTTFPGLVEFASLSGGLLASTIAARADSDRDARRIAAIIDATAFEPVFQPIVELGTGRRVGFEALTRFDDGTRPDLVFRQADESGLGFKLELATLRAACVAAQRLPADAFVSVNVSPGLILAGGDLRAVLANRTRSVVLEVTEHEAVEDYEAIRRAVLDLGSDLRLAVDDAGAGAANFTHLVGLRPQYVKVDQGLVRGVNSDPVRQALIVALLHFASATDCRVIAEGIETEAERTVLARLGVELGQGYLLGRPAPAGTWIEDASDTVPPLRSIAGGRPPGHAREDVAPGKLAPATTLIHES